LLASVGSADLTALPDTSAASVTARILAKNKIKVAAPVAAPVQAIAQTTESADEKASQEKVKELASKLGVPFTNDLLSLGSNSAISDALIEKAVSAGKSVAQINAAMSTL
tara:strand:+ start:137 stop:466 length:330 start_codon:yes stop_codon:yes gene_type:complete